MSEYEASQNYTRDLHNGLDMAWGKSSANESTSVLMQNHTDIDASIHRYLKTAIEVGVFDKNNTGKFDANATS